MTKIANVCILREKCAKLWVAAQYYLNEFDYAGRYMFVTEIEYTKIGIRRRFVVARVAIILVTCIAIVDILIYPYVSYGNG